MHSKCDTNDDRLPPIPSLGLTHDFVFRLLRPAQDLAHERRRYLLSSRRAETPEEHVNEVVLGELRVKVERHGADRIDAVLAGKSASRDAGRELQPVLDRLLSEAREERRALVLHFETLEYFNSSTIAALVQFLRTATQAGVSIVVRYDASLKWQAMSFDALRRALKPFETQGGPSISFLDASRP